MGMEASLFHSWVQLGDGTGLALRQVNHLIQDATDPANLCLLFPGWQPWM